MLPKVKFLRGNLFCGPCSERVGFSYYLRPVLKEGTQEVEALECPSCKHVYRFCQCPTEGK